MKKNKSIKYTIHGPEQKMYLNQLYSYTRLIVKTHMDHTGTQGKDKGIYSNHWDTWSVPNNKYILYLVLIINT